MREVTESRCAMRELRQLPGGERGVSKKRKGGE